LWLEQPARNNSIVKEIAKMQLDRKQQLNVFELIRTFMVVE